MGWGGNKYKAKASNGFPSKLEEAIHNILLGRQKLGEISEIKRQQSVILQDGPREVQIKWKVDFSYTDNATNETHYCESKGIETSEYKLKLKLWRKNPPAKLEIWKGNYRKPYLDEVIDVEQK